MNLIRYHLPPVLWASMIFIASSLPGSSVSLDLFEGADKIAHFALFFIFTGLTHRSLSHLTGNRLRPRHTLILCVAIACLYGLLDEWHQAFVPGRTTSAADLLADAVGAGTYAMMAVFRGPGRV